MLEIYSDLFAIRLLGPSYFFSFVSMGFIIDPRPFNSNHPTYINRVGIMEQIIRENYKHWSIPSPKNRKAELSDSQITSKKDLIEYFFIQAQFFMNYESNYQKVIISIFFFMKLILLMNNIISKPIRKLYGRF